jgi:serine/threonine-protein kinase
MSDSQGAGSFKVDLSESTEPPAVATKDPYLGKTIDGRYVVESALGEGGMGVVYRGRHKVIDKKVAIKILRGNMASDREVAERFLQEARAASAIGNPHIVDISDFGQLPDGMTYFVMEFLQGKSLTKVMEETRPIPVKRLVRIARQLAEGLAAAHNAGIIHRDLKPDNIMLIDRGNERDFVKILDFGIAKVGDSNTHRLTKAGSIFGTPHYMSPEQAAGAPVAKQTDIYSLGIILYEMAAGKPPFDADNFMGILTMHMYKQPVPIRAIVPPPQDVPPGLEAIIMKCLSKKPELRYASMEDLARDLERFEQGAVPEAVSEMMARSGGFAVPADYFRSSQMPPALPATPPSRRRPWPVYAGVAGVLAAIVIVVAIFAKSSSTNADNKEPVRPAATSTAPAQAATATQAPPAPSALRIRHPVAVAVEPSDARVTKGDEELKNPVVLQLEDGESVSLTIARAGYVSQTITVDASERSRLVKLVPAPTKPTPATKPTTTRPSGGEEFRDLWKK